VKLARFLGLLLNCSTNAWDQNSNEGCRHSRNMEKHFTATETVRDVVIGMADSLTVPLAAGLSAVVSNTSVIVTAGSARN
jgi:hypothetical protein